VEGPEASRGGHKVSRRGLGGRVLLPCGALIAPFCVIPTLKNPINRETHRNNPRTWTPPPQAFVPLKYHLERCSGTLPEGGTITRGHLHHPGGLHDEEEVVHPRGWGYVPVAMCLISLSFFWDGTILMYRELCRYRWIIWSSSPLYLLDELSFPFEVFLSDWVFKDLRALNMCFAWG
jgi:hypothetical protein